MRFFTFTFVTAALFLSSHPATAQVAVDPSGHWEGSATMPGNMAFEIDFVKDSSGRLGGTVTVPAQNLRGLPLLKVTVEGASVAFYARTDQPFSGSVSADGKSMSGDLAIQGFSVPFRITRTGDTRIVPVPKGGAIGREFEGTWNGTLESGGESLRLVLTLSNRPDGSSVGTIVNLDEGGLQIPVAGNQQASTLTLDASAIGGSYTGVVNAAGTEIVGTYKQGPAGLPLTFRRAGR